MASPELARIIEKLKNRPDYRTATMQQMRQGLDALTAAYPPEEGVACDTVDAGGVKAAWITPPGVDRGRVIYYLHGGAYVRGSIASHGGMVSRIAQSAGARALLLEYRLGPEHPFPAAVDDALTGYRWLLKQGVDPARMAIVGDSSGGGLTLAALVALRDAGDPLPATAVCLSPWVDLEATGDSMQSKADVDPFIEKEYLLTMARHYLGDADPRSPLAAPLYADLQGLPPLFIQVGTAEVLLDDSTRIAERARAAGVQVTLEPWEGMIHGWHLFAPELPEGQAAIDRIGAYLQECLG